jgi:hypothetical protein
MTSAVTWVSVQEHGNKKVVVRFTPSLEDRQVQVLDEVHLVGNDIAIVDNAGNLWADHLSFEGKFCGIKTHRGTLLLSFYPFKNAENFGIASGNRLELALGKNLEVNVISKTPFVLGTSPAKLYGKYLPERKSDRLTSSGITTDNHEDRFLKNIQR